MTTAEAINHLLDRAERGVLLREEAANLREYVSALTADPMHLCECPCTACCGCVDR